MRTLNRRDFLKSVAIGTGVLSLPGCMNSFKTSSHKYPDKPNFIIIFTDDQGYADIGCFGAEGFETPNLDQMAREGIKFTDFYAAASICTPSRAALLTGCYPERVSMPRVLFPKDKIGLNPDEDTIADVLRERGYATACIGKWHLGHLPQFLPTRQGFDYYFGLPYSNDMSPLMLIEGQETIDTKPDQSQLTQKYTEKAIDFIKKNRNRPFLVYLPHTMPHVPLFVSEKFKGKSQKGIYGDVIMEIDWSTGEILKTLKELSLDEKTLVIFTSDNGPWLSKGEHGGSSKPLREGKFSAYEGGMRSPCIMRWPGVIPAQSVCSEIATTMDFLPTLAALSQAKLRADRTIDGKNIFSLMTNPNAKTPHQAFFYYFQGQLEAIRSGEWKLILAHNRGKETVPMSLYNLKKDISEQNDISAENPEIVKYLSGLADNMRQELGDKIIPTQGRSVRPPGRV
ncbi:MAG: arylsulfatase [Candidatus Brocadiia bacterium]|nr:MAG: arylsulfatase [Candidatus Brocadiia bacterium]